jgi:hypothetical protein
MYLLDHSRSEVNHTVSKPLLEATLQDLAKTLFFLQVKWRRVNTRVVSGLCVAALCCSLEL